MPREPPVDCRTYASRYTTPQPRALAAGVLATRGRKLEARATRAASRMRRAQSHVGRPLLLLVLAAAGVHAAVATCPFSLTLSAGGGAAVAPADDAGWCPPFASAGAGNGVAGIAATCTGISVPAGGVLKYGTCHLPGATCAGATALTVVNGSGVPLSPSTDRVALNGSAAALSQGCVLGARCSYAEWRNPALSTATVGIAEGCWGVSDCAGVVAWRVGTDAETLPALAPSSATLLVFSVTAQQAVTLTGAYVAGRDQPARAELQLHLELGR